MRRPYSVPMRLALLFAFCALVPAAEAQYGIPLNCDVPQRNGDCALYGISLIQLLANPAKFDGEHVRVTGYIHFESDNDAIYLHREDAEHHLRKNGLWVALAPGQALEECQDAYVLLEGVYQARTAGRASLWSGTITRITRCVKVP